MILNFRKLKRVLRWMPVIWKLYGDDYGDILLLLEKQFSEMEHAYRNNAVTADAPRYADQIHVALLLVRRLLAYSYSDMAFDYNYTGPAYLDGHFVRRKHVPKQEVWDYEDYMKQQDLNYLCELMRKNFFCWWD